VVLNPVAFENTNIGNIYPDVGRPYVSDAFAIVLVVNCTPFVSF
jgi:hypothetical protein